MLLMVPCFPDNTVSRFIILDVAKFGICDVAKIPLVIFEVFSGGICATVNPVRFAPLP